MIRAFVALDLPDDVQDALEEVQQHLPVPRVVGPENLHLTLLFLGDVAEPDLEEVHLALAGIEQTPFELALRGVGMFGGAKPRAVYADVTPNAGLMQLQAKLVGAARRAGLLLPHRRFVPHVTLARLTPARGLDRARLDSVIAGQMGFAAPDFAVTDFVLYASTLGPGGARYDELARYPLG